MLDRAMDRIDDALAPYGKAISIGAGIWFWAGCALTAGFIALPAIPYVTETLVFWSGAAFNAVWWGFLRPAIQTRRRARALAGRDGAGT